MRERGDAVRCEVVTLDNEAAGEIDLAEAVFGVPVRNDLLQRTVVWQLAGRRSGGRDVQGRSDVTGTGAKPYKQKGTGRARHGNRKVSQFRGGGRAFGPRRRDHGTGLPKKVRRLALKCALSSKRAEGKLVVIDAARAEEPKTGALARRLAGFGWPSALIVDGPEVDANFRRAAGNLPRLDILPSQGANVYDILRRDVLVLTRAGVAALEARLS